MFFLLTISCHCRGLYVISCDIAQTISNTTNVDGSTNKYQSNVKWSGIIVGIVDLFLSHQQFNTHWLMVHLFFFLSYFPNCIIPLFHIVIIVILFNEFWNSNIDLSHAHSTTLYFFHAIIEAILWKPFMRRVNIVILWFDLS